MLPLKAYRQEQSLKSTQDNNNKSPVYNTRLEFSGQNVRFETYNNKYNSLHFDTNYKQMPAKSNRKPLCTSGKKEKNDMKDIYMQLDK